MWDSRVSKVSCSIVSVGVSVVRYVAVFVIASWIRYSYQQTIASMAKS